MTAEAAAPATAPAPPRAADGIRTVGVEEELLLVHPEDGSPVAAARDVLRAAGRAGTRRLGAELQLQQVETATAPVRSVEELLAELVALRGAADAAARQVGTRAAALATSPLPVRPTLSTDPRYLAMRDRMGLTCAEQLTCGCHVHVAVTDDEEGVGVIDRIRTWLPLLIALSASSPLWNGRDTSFASYRTQAWSRWPGTGPTEVFGSAAAYRTVVERMLATGTLLDPGMVYFDARLSHRYPTIEIRVADVCLDVRDAALVAVLSRALVQTAADEWRAGLPAPARPTVLLRLASWRASRVGLTDALTHPDDDRLVPAADALGALVRHVAPALEESGELAWVRGQVGRVLRDGTGAERQRAVLRTGGSVPDVVAAAVRATAADPRVPDRCEEH
ncbi:carboxylate-amine ligase [Cellulomonas massiliensis]|uniref:carboxylate-amine ligase n=1 Tax=Cellulomonas massiliensis TaxID=1465811 RepID=UPI00030A3BD5|nr:glutamate--cysteine ligase [Cellulomonas massiliensis]